jgi:hypothetical protein
MVIYDLDELFSFAHDTVCFTKLDHGSEMIIFDSILTSFIETIIFRGYWGNGKKLAQA